MRTLRYILFFVVAACFGQGTAFAQAVIEGKVSLQKPGNTAALNRRYQTQVQKPVMPPDDPVAAVYLEGDFKDDLTGDLTAVMKQEGYQFRPGLLVVQKGATVTFPNLDEEYHNILSYSKAKPFDLGRYRGDDAPPAVVFDQAGIVKTYCEIHENMRGTIIVVDSPYFTTTDTDGNYRLEGLPPGKYRLKAWAGKKKKWERTVELKAGETVQADFT